MMSLDVISWRDLLAAVAVFNLLAWCLSAMALNRRRAAMPTGAFRVRRWQLVLSAIYVLGCGFRSFFPVYDVPRIVLFDHWVSSVAMGRSVATLAELCFVAQLAVLLNEISRAARSTVGVVTSLAVVPLIMVAETFSWYSVLTTSNIGHVVEESLWALSVALLVASVATIYPRCVANRRPLLIGWCVAGMVYVAYMVMVDVPMYWARWVADEAVGRHYMTVAQGFLDVSTHRVVTHSWNAWKTEVVWMSLYFSVAVWLSISLIHAPEPEGYLEADAAKPPRTRRQAAGALGGVSTL
jgi:hypothetical protein